MGAHRFRVIHPRAGEGEEELVLDPEESHHLSRVLRLRAGETVGVFDGTGREWEATVVAPDPKGTRVHRGRELGGRPDSALRVALAQALGRPDHVEWALQKGTEIGIAEFALFPALRSEGPLPSPSRLARWRKIVLEACKQSGRRVVPPVELRDALPRPDGASLLLSTEEDAPPLARVLAPFPDGPVSLAVGPEGGFEKAESASLADLGWTTASLGPRTLRTETAGPVAAAIVLHLRGDLGR